MCVYKLHLIFLNTNKAISLLTLLILFRKKEYVCFYPFICFINIILEHTLFF